MATTIPYPYEDTEQSHSVISPFGHEQSDVEYQLGVNEEAFRVTAPEVEYFPFDRVNTKKDNLYGEYTEVPKYRDPIKVPMYIFHEPEKKLLKKYGIEAELDALGVMCVRINEDLGIKPQTGDRVLFLDILMEVVAPKYCDYLQSTQTPLNQVLILKNANPL